MRKIYLLVVVFVFSFFYSNTSSAQLVGTNLFLQGKYVEIGMNNNGSFGACNSATYGTIPAGYHPHLPGTSALAEVYDYGHDGWATGAPPYMGDYTYPGSPFEGWAIQVNGVRGQCYQTCAGNVTFNAGWLSGTNSGYVNSGGRALGYWTGSAATGALSLRMETRVDTLASWVNVTVVMKNTTSSAIPGVYYWRSCDPDNDESWPGGGFSTNNMIVYQNDVNHRVLVRAQGSLGAIAWLGLGTKDCRAKCCVYSSWGLSSSVDLGTVWSGTYVPGSTLYAAGATNTGDVGIGLVYNIGTIAALDSAIISYAYMFSNSTAIDSAFPEPRLSVGGITFPPTPSPGIERDTFNACLFPGMLTAPVSILNASDKSWSWSKWTWSPGTGLASTTGVTNTISVMGIPNYTTYTITGTDSSTGMQSCNTKTFILTIINCGIWATANSPCEGDSLLLKAHGDSLGATYQWYGPAPSTTVFATTQYAFRYPATAAMAGLYHVIRIQGSDADTAAVNVTINPTPTIGGILSVCVGGTTNLTGTPPGGTWSGGSPTTATISSAGVVTGINVGTTMVTYRSPAGCTQTAVITVYTTAPPTGSVPICQGYTLTLTGPTSGGTWSSQDPTIATVGPTTGIVTGVSGGNTNITYDLGGGCVTWKQVTINPTPAPITGTPEVCQYFATTLSDASAGGTWASSNTAVATINSSGVVNGLTGGTTTITYRLPTTCYITQVFTVHPKPAKPTVVPAVSTYCQFAIPVPLAAVGSSLLWYGPGVTAAMTTAPTPGTSVPGTTTYYVTQTTPYGCVSDSNTAPVTVYPHPDAPLVRDTMYCQGTTVPALTAIGSNLKWYNASGTLLSSAPIPPTTFVGTTTWYVTQSINGCESDKSPISVTIIFKPDFTINASSTKVCQHDSLTFSYNGPAMPGAGYLWDLPTGAVPIMGTSIYDSLIVVRFDSANTHNTIYLTGSNLNGMCNTTVSLDIKVIPQPAGFSHIKRDICKGDTILLALSSHTYNALEFNWLMDGASLFSNPALNIITASSSTGGPFLVSFNDTGRHIFTVTTYADEGNKCPSLPTYDTCNVHALPDADFDYKIMTGKSRICLEDSVWFQAKTDRYNYTYTWAPDHSFSNTNVAGLWGRVESQRSTIKLTVVDPFGCKSTVAKDIYPEYCCNVFMPTGFTPNGDTWNNRYKPVFSGYHRFHIFRITNRWGQTLFESTDSDPSWDGTYNGVPQDMGVYFYYIKYDCGGKTIEQKGDCTLVR